MSDTPEQLAEKVRASWLGFGPRKAPEEAVAALDSLLARLSAAETERDALQGRMMVLAGRADIAGAECHRLREELDTARAAIDELTAGVIAAEARAEAAEKLLQEMFDAWFADAGATIAPFAPHIGEMLRVAS